MREEWGNDLFKRRKGWDGHTQGVTCGSQIIIINKRRRDLLAYLHRASLFLHLNNFFVFFNFGILSNKKSAAPRGRIFWTWKNEREFFSQEEKMVPKFSNWKGHLRNSHLLYFLRKHCYCNGCAYRDIITNSIPAEL